MISDDTNIDLGKREKSYVFWKDSGEFTTTALPNNKDRFKVIFSGGEQSRRGTAMIIRNKAIESLMYYQTISDRSILSKYKGRPVDILIIQELCSYNSSR